MGDNREVREAIESLMRERPDRAVGAILVALHRSGADVVTALRALAEAYEVTHAAAVEALQNQAPRIPMGGPGNAPDPEPLF